MGGKLSLGGKLSPAVGAGIDYRRWSWWVYRLNM
ncbi:unnamed protein product, partial [marine sediment metagenome]